MSDYTAKLDLGTGKFSYARPVKTARATRSSNQSVTTATDTLVTFTDLLEDTGGFWNAGEPTKFTIPEDGVYTVAARVVFAANGTGARLLAIRKNGTQHVAADRLNNAGAADSWDKSVSVTRRFAKDDYVEVQVRQSSGGALNCVGILANEVPLFSITKVGD